MADILHWAEDELRELRAEGLLRRRRVVLPLPGGECLVETGRERRRLRNFSTNDYLNLAYDPRVVEAARTALEQTGAGARASAAVSGRTDWHARLESRLAEFEGREAALLFPSGYAANTGCIAALVGLEDAVFCDRLNHASLVDGCRLSGARLRVYRHGDLERLERGLERAQTARRRLIVTDSVFSMDGDIAPLGALCDLAERHDAALLVDEAHGTGVFGEQGRGALELTGQERRAGIVVGTLSKALGSLGGFVSGTAPLIELLANRARTQVFSTALPASACAAALAALQVIVAEPWRRTQLLSTAASLRARLLEAELPLVPGGTGPIVPIVLGDPHRAVQAAEALEQQGLLVPAIRPPTVPAGTSRLRISLTAAHTEEDVGRLTAALRAVLPRGG